MAEIVSDNNFREDRTRLYVKLMFYRLIGVLAVVMFITMALAIHFQLKHAMPRLHMQSTPVVQHILNLYSDNRGLQELLKGIAPHISHLDPDYAKLMQSHATVTRKIDIMMDCAFTTSRDECSLAQ